MTKTINDLYQTYFIQAFNQNPQYGQIALKQLLKLQPNLIKQAQTKANKQAKLTNQPLRKYLPQIAINQAKFCQTEISFSSADPEQIILSKRLINLLSTSRSALLQKDAALLQGKIKLKQMTLKSSTVKSTMTQAMPNNAAKLKQVEPIDQAELNDQTDLTW